MAKGTNGPRDTGYSQERAHGHSVDGAIGGLMDRSLGKGGKTWTVRQPSQWAASVLLLQATSKVNHTAKQTKGLPNKRGAHRPLPAPE